MALPQQLPGVSVVPQAPQVDPRLFAPDAAGMLLSARAGVQLGTELAGLQNLQSRLTLEKAEIAAKKAKNEFERQAAEQAVITLPQMVQQQLAQAQAATAQAQASIPTFQPLAGAAIAEAGARTAGSQFSLAQIKAGIEAGLPQFNAELQKLKFENEKKTALANAGFFGKDTPGQEQAIAEAKARGTVLGDIGGKIQAANPNAPTEPTAKAPFFFNKFQPVDIFGAEGNLPSWATDWKTSTETRPDGTEVVVSQAFNKYTGQPVAGKRKDVAIVGVKSDPDRVKITGLLQARDMAEQLIETLDSYGKKDRGGILQSGFAKLANMPATGTTSVIGKAIGYSLQSEATAGAASQITKLNSTVLKSVAGSAVTDSERSNTSALLPEVGDLVNPQGAQAKARQTLDYIKTQLEPYERSGAVKRARLGDEPASSAPAALIRAPAKTQPLSNLTPVTGKVRNRGGRQEQMVSYVDGSGKTQYGWVATQ